MPIFVLDRQPDLWARLRVHPSTSVPQDSMRDDSTPCPADTRSRSKRSPLGDLLQDSTETKKNEDNATARGSPLRDLPEWSEEFTDIFVGEEASASCEAPASISRGPHHQEPSRKVVSGQHSIFTHFPKDRN